MTFLVFSVFPAPDSPLWNAEQYTDTFTQIICFCQRTHNGGRERDSDPAALQYQYQILLSGMGKETCNQNISDSVTPSGHVL